MATAVRQAQAKVRDRAQTTFDRLYTDLNREQRTAVDAIEGPVMVLAGPGTGKTQVLAMRIANILHRTQMDPWNILCLTFTESAAVAMRERLLNIIGTTAYAVRIATFHSFCNSIVSQHPEIFALAADWRILSQVERIELLRGLLDELPGGSGLKPFANPYMFIREIAGNIQALKQENISPRQLKDVLRSLRKFLQQTGPIMSEWLALTPAARTITTCRNINRTLAAAAAKSKLPPALTLYIENLFREFVNGQTGMAPARSASAARTAYKNKLGLSYKRMERLLPKQKDMAVVYERYGRKCRDRGRYDFEDMISMVIEQWQKVPDLLAESQEQFQYILVDEYQDTNGAQNQILALLGSQHDAPNIFVVGDDKQSIFRFQGASISNMLDFYRRYADHVAVVALQKNYRSQPEIIESASALIERNKESLAAYLPQARSQLTAAGGKARQPLVVLTAASEEAEDWLLLQQVKLLIAGGASPRSIAVLFRYHRDGRLLLETMRRAGVPARLEAGENVLDDILIAQFLKLLSYLAGEQDDDILADIVQYEWWGADNLDTLKALHYAGRTRRPLILVLSDASSLADAGVKHAEVFQKIIKQIAAWRTGAANTTLLDWLHRILEESGVLAAILRRSDQAAILQKIAAVLNEAKRQHQVQANLTLRNFITSLRLLAEHQLPLMVDPWMTSAEAVRLMTAHKSKGLEFDHVFITRLNDRHWGNNPEPNRVPLPHGLVRFEAIAARENNEDERRLFYVAATRAKQSLTLTRATHTVSGAPTVPSMFLEEIPKAHLLLQPLPDLPAAAWLTPSAVHGRVRDMGAADGASREWADGVLRGYVLSITHLNNYLECPLKYYLTNLLQIPAARTLSQALGSAVHNALHDFTAAMRRAGKTPSKDVLLAGLAHQLRHEVMTAAHMSAAQEVGKRLLSSYYDHYAHTFSPHVVSEYSFASHGAHVDGIPISGRVDKIELVDSRAIPPGGAWPDGAAVNVVDYKTGNADRGLGGLKKGGPYRRQLAFYQLLCNNSPRFPYRMTSGEIDFIRASDRRGFVKKKIVVSEPELIELKETIKRVWREIHNLKFLEADARCGKCEVCARMNRM